MDSHLSYFDAGGQFQTFVPVYGSERQSLVAESPRPPS